MAGRQTRGRQRIPIRRIENEDDMYATFSKRRAGLYRKASELSTLCGIDIGVIIFSPTNNPYSFFHPSMESVVNRYRNPNLPTSSYERVLETEIRSRIDELNKRLDELLDEKDELKQDMKDLDKTRHEKGWWEETPIESLNGEQVKEWTAFFQDFKDKLENRIQELKNGGSTSRPVQHQNPDPSMFGLGASYCGDPTYAGGSGLMIDQQFYPSPTQDLSVGTGSGDAQGPFFFPPPYPPPSDGGSGLMSGQCGLPQPPMNPSVGGGSIDPVAGQYSYVLSRLPSVGGTGDDQGQRGN